MVRYFTHGIGILSVTLCAAVWTSCGSREPSPTTPTPPPSTPAPAVILLTVSGNGQLTALGQTSQLTAMATLSDNTTTDVSGSAKWMVNDPRVVNVSTTGLLTVMQFGATSVFVQYQNKGATLAVTASPAGTFVISGRVREPGAGGIANVQVVDTLSGHAATTNTLGEFSVAELPRPQAHFKLELTGFEPTEVDATQNSIDLPVQRLVRLTAGETVKPDPLAPNDLAYIVGSAHCTDCHLIRVIVPQAGTVHVHVTWTAMDSKLSLLTEGQVVAGGSGDLTAVVPVNAPREVLMYLGTVPPNAIHSKTSFTFETTMQ